MLTQYLCIIQFYKKTELERGGLPTVLYNLCDYIICWVNQTVPFEFLYTKI